MVGMALFTLIIIPGGNFDMHYVKKVKTLSRGVFCRWDILNLRPIRQKFTPTYFFISEFCTGDLSLCPILRH